MTAHNKQTLREAAQEEIMLRSVSDTSDAWQDEASPEAVLALLDELEAAEKRIAELEKGHCGAPLLDREVAHVKTVSGLLAELGRWQQESSTWQSVAEKQLAIAIEAEKRIAELIHIISMHTVELGFGEKPITMAELIIAREGSGSDVLAAIRAAGISVKGE